MVRAEGLGADEFWAEFAGPGPDLVDRLYDLDALAAAYREWLADAQRMLAGASDDVTDGDAFALRSHLVHEWRKFLFRDPGLPLELLPQPWPGSDAAAYFNEHAERLLPAASAFVDCCLHRRSP